MQLFNAKLMTVGIKGTQSRLKYRVFIILDRNLLQAYFIILKLEETIAKSDIGKKNELNRNNNG